MKASLSSILSFLLCFSISKLNTELFSSIGSMYDLVDISIEITEKIDTLLTFENHHNSETNR
jgi:hypothetical protein